MGGQGRTAVVVPMYNEATVIGTVVDGLVGPFDLVICVDDGSHDASAQVASAHGATVVRHPLNLGQGAALQTGFAYALEQPDVDFVVTFDADGQHRLEDADRMVQLARDERLDVVLGSRFLDSDAANVPWLRRQILRMAITFTRATTGLGVTDTHNGLRVLSRRALARIDITLNGMAHASEILSQVARHDLPWKEAPVTIDYTEYSRAKGQSHINAINILLDLAGRRLRH